MIPGFRPTLLRAAASALLLHLSASVFAEDRALLIGVGDYANPQVPDLVGIQTDLENMAVMSELLGFKQIKKLQDREATSANVQHAIEEWLIKGTGPQDRALLYFSGHGTRIPDQNGDEQDKTDEVLVTYDVTLSNGTLSGVLVDDDLHRLLKAVPAKEVLVFIDACHSGSATRSIRLGNLSSGVGEGQSKFFSYKGMPQTGGAEVAMATRAGDESLHYIALSAASDDEQALATSKGSLFTRAVTEIISQGVQKESLGIRGTKRVKAQATQVAEGLTLAYVHQQATQRIAQYVTQNQQISNDRIHHPQLTGNPQLARRALRVRPITLGHGPRWERFLALVNQTKNPLPIQSNEQSYEEGDELQLSMQIPIHKGYLNIIQVDTNDQVNLLYPNQFQTDNRVEKGRFDLPLEGFQWTVQEPYGPTLIVAILTRKKVNLYEESDGKRDGSGRILETFPTMNPVTASRAFGTVAATSGSSIHATALVVQTCKEMAQCP